MEPKWIVALREKRQGSWLPSSPEIEWISGKNSFNGAYWYHPEGENECKKRKRGEERRSTSSEVTPYPLKNVF